MTETGFRDPTQQSHASHDPSPAERQWCNLKTDVPAEPAGEQALGHEIDGLRGCPIDASEHKKPLDNEQRLPNARTRSQKPGRPPPK